MYQGPDPLAEMVEGVQKVLAVLAEGFRVGGLAVVPVVLGVRGVVTASLFTAKGVLGGISPFGLKLTRIYPRGT